MLLPSWFTRGLVHHAPYPQLRPSLAAPHPSAGMAPQMTRKKEGECFPRAGPAHVPAGVFKMFSPGRKINIWMIMRRVGWAVGEPGNGEGGRGWGSVRPGSLLTSRPLWRRYLPTSLDLSAAALRPDLF